ncbi:MAG: phosphoenolpyruvate carboxykinase [Candidatus Omnitrophota bacterium]|jgi:hypothetical protein
MVDPSVCTFRIEKRKVFIRLRNQICDSPEELLESPLCFEIFRRCVRSLVKRDSTLLKIFGPMAIDDAAVKLVLQTCKYLTNLSADLVPNIVKGSEVLLWDRSLFNDFIEYIYNYWRHYDRFILCDSEGDSLDQRPYRTFNQTIENLTMLVRKTYRDMQESITGNHPRIYRQLCAGAEVAAIALPKDIPQATDLYKKLNEIPVIRQILFYPPLVLNPPMNKRTGRFERVASNPLEGLNLDDTEWLCYPAKVGSLIILVYFHQDFYELGFSLSNLFELAGDEDLKRKPDAVYLYGVPPERLKECPQGPTVFFDDEANGMLVGVVPRADEFGYFGYLKKMILTLHNIKKMKEGKMPFHGAFVKIYLKGGRQANMLLIGDTGAGKSETLEALREFGEGEIRDIVIVADDMGSLEVGADGEVSAFGTEIGAFLRLDDLKPGYAFGQMDRAIIMSAKQVNARIVFPVTTFVNLITKHRVDFVLYANNYEEIDEDHPTIERFGSVEDALKVFQEGTVMSKGTTTSTGLVHSYFANVFGPAQYKDLHKEIARRFFTAFFQKGIFVGQMRTRLGISGWEHKGPEESARELLRVMQGDKRP